MVVGVNDNPDDSGHGIVLNNNEKQKQESPLVMKPIGGGGKHVPLTWQASNSGRLAAENSEFLHSFGNANTGMIWKGYNIRFSVFSPLQASILTKPFFFLNEPIASSGSLSASGRLIIGSEKGKLLDTRYKAEQTNSPVKNKKNSDLIRDGKIDMDLILIISAGVSGLILILIPERKRKRDLIKETNLALLRRPRQ